MKRPILLAILAITGATTLSACYVVPLDHQSRPGNVAYAPVPVAIPPVQTNLVARLYPANDAAAPHGVLVGQVTNNLNGRGTFTVNMSGEQFTGEATRDGQSANRGNANAVGTRGGYLNCAYTMNTSTQGSGECRFASGARFTMHLTN